MFFCFSLFMGCQNCGQGTSFLSGKEDERASLILLPDKEINKGKVYCKFFS